MDIKTLNSSPGYRAFVNKRDDALEKILDNTRRRNFDHMNRHLKRVIEIVASRYDSIKGPTGLFSHQAAKQRLASLEQDIQRELEHLALDLYQELASLRKKTYLLAFLGEHRAIHISTNKSTRPQLTAHELEQRSIDSKLYGAEPLRKISFHLSKLRNRICSAVELSAIMDEDVHKAMGRVYLALPKVKHLPRRAELKRVKITEAKRTGSDALAINLGPGQKSIGWEIDPETWQQLVDDYQDEYIPVDRSPANVFDIKNPFSDEPVRDDIPTNEAFYGWEVEQEITHDFVDQVRQGQIDAANQNGIDDFVVISIVDDKTCENCCGEYGCVDFHGKLVSEVEEMTKGESDVPPYHFNCRCTLAPASSDLEMVDTTQSEKDFDEWLNS